MAGSGTLPVTATEARFLQKLVADRPARRIQSAAAMWFCENHRIGTAFARHVEYQERHFEQARQLLELHGIPVQTLEAGTSRGDAARYTGQSEKSQSRAPWSDTVAVRICTPAGRIWGQPGSFLMLTVSQAIEAQCDLLLVVENLETFRHLERYRWLGIDEMLAQRSVMALYRGDSTASTADAVEVMRRRTEPIHAFTDFDPAGLGIAAALPRLERLLLPDAQWLAASARGPRCAELYERSLNQFEQTLDACTHLEIVQAWRLLKSLRAGVAQEGMERA